MKDKQSLQKIEIEKSTETVADPETADAFAFTNAFGTYEVQKTADTENEFPTIAQGKPKEKQ